MSVLTEEIKLPPMPPGFLEKRSAVFLFKFIYVDAGG